MDKEKKQRIQKQIIDFIYMYYKKNTTYKITNMKIKKDEIEFIIEIPTATINFGKIKGYKNAKTKTK